MIAPSARTTIIAVAAAALTGSAAFAQQFANLDEDRRTFLSSQCDHLQKDPPRHAGCYAEKSIEFSRAKTATAKQGILDATVLKTCLTYLQQQRASGKTFDRTITRENACGYARELGMRDGPG